MYSIRALAIAVLVIILVAPATRQGDVKAQSAQPIRTINRDRAKVFYNENPSAVAVATTFYAIGSHKNSLWRDFLAITADFVASGQTITKPRCVQLHFASSTRTKGDKYRTDHRLTILTDGKLLLSTDLNVGPTADNGRGGLVELLELPQLSFEQFTELAQAKEVRMRFGATEFKLKKEHLEALRSMLSSIGS